MSLKTLRTICIAASGLLFLLYLCRPTKGAAGCDGSGNCYIYASASGSGNGSSWTNAFTDFGTGAGKINPGSMARGVTYWIAAGTYTGSTFSTADSGTTVITIEAATTANHGPDSTWSNSYAGQAVLSGANTISTDYWTFNGQTRGADWRSGYNLKFNGGTCCDGGADLIVTASGITIEYVELEGSNDNFTSSTQDDGVHFNGGANTGYIGYSWLHDTGCDIIGMFTNTGMTFEYNVLERNDTNSLRSSGCHSQAFAVGNTGTLIIRYNYFRDIINTGVIDDVNVSNSSFTPSWYIYGNTNYWTTSVYTGSYGGQATDGMLGLFGEILNGGVIQIYNNNIAAVNVSQCASSIDCSEVFLYTIGTSGSCPNYSFACCASSCPTITLYNNLEWNPFAGGDASVAGGNPYTITADYGEGYCPSGGCSNGGSYSTSGSHGVFSKTGNPFVDFDGSANFNFSLVADTTAGIAVTNWASLPAGCTASVNCFNIDPLGVVRGADGTIDRGAFQIPGGTPNAPMITAATPH